MAQRKIELIFNDIEIINNALKLINKDGVVAKRVRIALDEIQTECSIQMSVSSAVPEAAASTDGDFPVTLPVYGVKFNSVFEMFFLASHVFLLRQGFICTVEAPSSVPGFAPAIKEIPRGKLIHDSWNASGEAGVLSAMYKHKLGPGKKYCLSAMSRDQQVQLTFTQQGNAAAGVAVMDPLEFVQPGRESSVAQTGVDPLIQVLDALQCRQQELGLRLTALVTEVSPATVAKSAPTAAPATIGLQPPSISAGGSVPLRSVQPVAAAIANDPMVPSRSGLDYPSPGPRYDVGRGDLVPDFGASDPSRMPFPGAPFGEAGGSLVGPGHPMFSDRGGSDGRYGYVPESSPFFPGVGAVPGLPIPRFDPFGPVTGPNGPDFGNTELPGGGRGVFPGRGAGRGRGGRARAPGEPNPDHLSPPDFNDGFI